MSMKIPFKVGEFLTSKLSLEMLPLVRNSHGISLDEIAIAGRSNVGKSSLLNHLLSMKKLAKVSSKPGKTRLLNFFLIDDKICLVDLPGYGFAKAAKKEQLEWSKSIDIYLNTRKQLKLLLILIDLRHPPMNSDLELIKWTAHRDVPALIIFTKSDKLPSRLVEKQAEKNLQIIQEKTGFIPNNSVLYSIKDLSSKTRLTNKINEMLWGT